MVMTISADLTLLFFISSVPLSQEPSLPLAAFLWTLFGIASLFFLLLLALIAFHAFLNCAGLTTYQFFVEGIPAPKPTEQSLDQTRQEHLNRVEHQEATREYSKEPPGEDTKEKPREYTEEDFRESSEEAK